MADVLDALEAAQAASAATIDALQAKVDAAVQLLNDLKGAAGMSVAQQARVQAVVDGLTGETGKSRYAEGALDAAVAPPASVIQSAIST